MSAGELGHLRLAGLVDHLRPPEGNSTSDWKTKRSPTMRMFSRSDEDFAQPAEEVGAVAVDSSCTRWASATLRRGRDRRSWSGFACRAGLETSQRLLERGDLAAQRRDLLVEQLDLAERALADLAFWLGRVRRSACRCGHCRPRRRRRRPGRAAAAAAVALGLGGRALRLADWRAES
jgi:hypothetical protein